VEPPHGGRIEDRTRQDEGSAYDRVGFAKEFESVGPQAPGNAQEAGAQEAGLAKQVEGAAEPGEGHEAVAQHQRGS
jgi:hypothetical protein